MDPKPPSDFEQALVAARAGSSAALGQLLEACRHYLLWIATSELDSDLQAKGGASDLVQDTLLNAARQFAGFHGQSRTELQAWLRRILLNNLANFRRRYQGTEKRLVAREISLDDPDSRHDLHEHLVLDTPSPRGRAIGQEELEALEQAVNRLPEQYRQVLRWRHEEKRSFEEIGGLLGRSADAGRMLWGRAIARLQREMRAAP